MRGVLHVAAAPIGQLPLCRQTQAADLQTFLGQGIQKCVGGSIYVSGVPGTGIGSETACVVATPLLPGDLFLFANAMLCADVLVFQCLKSRILAIAYRC